MTIEMGEPDRFPDGRIVVDGNLLAWGFFQGLYSDEFVGIMPLLIRELSNRNADVMAGLADSLVPEPGYSMGLQFAVNCYELIGGISQDMIAADEMKHPELAIWQSYADQDAICAALHDVRAGPSELTTVYSDIPTLVGAGEFDPTTPPSYGRLATRTLPNSTYVEVRNASHGAIPFDDCANGLMHAFLENPGGALDTGCVSGIAPATFTTDVYLNAGVYRLVKTFQGTLPPVRLAGLGLIGWLAWLELV